MGRHHRRRRRPQHAGCGYPAATGGFGRGGQSAWRAPDLFGAASPASKCFSTGGMQKREMPCMWSSRGKKCGPHIHSPRPDVVESAARGVAAFTVLALPALVRMALAAFRLDDRVDLQDMLEVGLINATWVPRLGPVWARAASFDRHPGPIMPHHHATATLLPPWHRHSYRVA